MLKDFFASIQKYQYPDKVVISKQRYNGFWIKCIWFGNHRDLMIQYDITPNYIRCIGQEDKIPIFKPGIHRYWDETKSEEKEREKLRYKKISGED